MFIQIRAFDRFLSDLNLPCQHSRLKSKIARSELGQEMLSDSCHYTTDSYHLRRPANYKAATFITKHSVFTHICQQLQPKHGGL